MNPIQNLNLPSSLPTAGQVTRNLETAQQPFKNLLLESLDHVNAMQQDADQAVEQLITGEDVNTAEVLTTIQKADMTFRMMLQIRNKLVQAYQELKEIRI